MDKGRDFLGKDVGEREKWLPRYIDNIHVGNRSQVKLLYMEDAGMVR